MEDHGMDIAKRQRMDSYGGPVGPPGSGLQQPPPHSADPQASLPMHGAHQRGPLQPPSVYQHQPPHSPYHPPPASAEQPPPGSYPHLAETDPTRNPKSAPPEQTTFSRGGTSSNPRSPRSGHLPRPAPLPFEEHPHYPSASGEHSHYPPQSSVDLVNHDVGFAPPDGAGHANHFGMRGPLPHYDPVPGGPSQLPPPGMGGPYSDAEMAHGGPAYYGAPHPSPGWTTHYAAPPARRHARAQQACDICRQRKVKCDEGKPKCAYCRENDQSCSYKDVQPPKQERGQREIMDGIQDLRSEVAQLRELLRGFQQSPPQARAVPEPKLPLPMPPPPLRLIQAEGKQEAPNSEHQPPPVHLEVDHSVGVHRLLRWPTIKRLFSIPAVLHALAINNISELSEDWVMQLEQKKGILRVFGRGQGLDRYEGTASHLSNPSTPTALDDPPVVGSPGASPPDVWGRGLGMPNLVNGRHSNNTPNDHPGGLTESGHLKMEPATMELLFNSYMQDMHSLHPFLSRARLKRMFDRVRIQMNPQLRPTGPSTSESVNKTRKRKYSSDGSPMGSTNGNPAMSSEEPFLEQRVTTAIVLMVMALGKICLSKRPLHGPVSDLPWETTSGTATNPMSPFSQNSPNIKASPLRQSPASSLSSEYRSHVAQARYDAMPNEAYRRDDRNIDVIPGLAYYAKGAEILGTLPGGTGLTHVQAMLLASLYCGQLASSIEAWSWLSQAGRACLVLMKGYPFAAEQQRDPIRVQLILFAYWTCYQFEGDILAELDLQPSGIEDLHKKEKTKEDDRIKYPQIIPEDPLEQQTADKMLTDRVMMFYSFQIHLRQSLNGIQPFLYPPDAYIKARNRDQLLKNRFDCRVGLQSWRQVLLPDLVWDDAHYRSDNILEARLRGKYYGALYIINRPLLEFAMHRMKVDATREIQDAVFAHRKAPLQTVLEIQNPYNDLEVYKACMDCITAAKRSTTAFDDIIFKEGELRNRLIVTNIVGTAQAQFGNMLVLSAAYRSRVGWMIERDELVTLLDRTIRFLRSHRPISYTLGKDALILEGILANIDGPLPDEMSSSFSSSTA